MSLVALSTSLFLLGLQSHHRRWGAVTSSCAPGCAGGRSLGRCPRGRPCSLLPEQAPIASQEQGSGFCEPGELERLGEERRGNTCFRAASVPRLLTSWFHGMREKHGMLGHKEAIFVVWGIGKGAGGSLFDSAGLLKWGPLALLKSDPSHKPSPAETHVGTSSSHFVFSSREIMGPLMPT